MNINSTILIFLESLELSDEKKYTPERITMLINIMNTLIPTDSIVMIVNIVLNIFPYKKFKYTINLFLV